MLNVEEVKLLKALRAKVVTLDVRPVRITAQLEGGGVEYVVYWWHRGVENAIQGVNVEELLREAISVVERT